MKQINFGNEQEFIDKYNELKSSRKMAEFYHCSKSTILNHAKKIGYDVHNNQTRKITDIPIEQVISDYEEFLSCKKVGEKYNCSGTAVQEYLKKNNYNIKNHNEKFSSLNYQEFIQDYSNLSFKELTKKYQCSKTTIINWAKKLNCYSLKGVSPLTKDDIEYIKKMYNEKTSNELAKEFNVSRGIITKIWFENKLCGKGTPTFHTTEKDITGQDFGFWHVLYKTEKRHSNGNIIWHCRCKCGVERDVSGASLRQHLSLSCGNHKNVSKGNYKISQLLLEANISFETEKIFQTCYDKTYLPFDFFINNTYLIEYDGIQHFQEGIYDYEYTHKHDLIKNQWCKDNNIPLIRIPYTKYNSLTLNDLLLESSSFIINNADVKSGKIGEA